MKLLWTKNMSVGIPQLDEDHKRLIRFVNELEMAIDGSLYSGIVDAAEFEITFHRMENYARQHFAAEESLMQSLHFPGIEVHKTAHCGFLHKTDELKKQYSGSTSPRDAQKIVKFLCAWITDHDYLMDSQYADFLYEQKHPPVAAHLVSSQSSTGYGGRVATKSAPR